MENYFTHRFITATLSNPCLLRPVLIGVLACASTGNASVVINEVDYDQVGSDTAEFIELFNTGTTSISLDGYRIDLINGSNSSIYRSIDLSGFTLLSGAYFVVCNDPTQVRNCNFDFTSTNGWIQNGAPDAIALYENEQLADALSYEGEIFPFTENIPVITMDSNSIQMSLSRFPDGFDSNANNLDFDTGCITPGTANILGSGDCSMDAVSAVPVPAAAWLFGSGLIGLAGISRKKLPV